MTTEDCRIVCYGDSNTYGYNPATGGKYSTCWVDLLSQHYSGTVINDGVPGREIPFSDEWLADADQMLIMLGSNDLLDGYSADDCGVRMRRFLSTLSKDRVILIAPAKFQRGTWVPSDDLVRESEKLQDVHMRLAEDMDISFITTASWQIPLCFDGVHFTEEGHRVFAEKLIRALQ